jgi:hypothetical protein
VADSGLCLEVPKAAAAEVESHNIADDEVEVAVEVDVARGHPCSGFKDLSQAPEAEAPVILP